MKAVQPDPSAQLSAFLSRFPSETIALATECLSKLRRLFPGSNEIVYDYAKSVVVSFSMSEHGYEAIVAVAIFEQSVKLYVDKSVPDPKELLEGSGTKVRSVTVSAASELDRGDIHVLIKAAIKQSGVKFARTGSTNLIIKSKSKSKK